MTLTMVSLFGMFKLHLQKWAALILRYFSVKVIIGGFFYFDIDKVAYAVVCGAFEIYKPVDFRRILIGTTHIALMLFIIALYDDL